MSTKPSLPLAFGPLVIGGPTRRAVGMSAAALLAADPSAHGPAVGSAGDVDLEGPWNTYEEFLAAERVRESLRREQRGSHGAPAGNRRAAAGARKKKTRAQKTLPPVQPRPVASPGGGAGPNLAEPLSEGTFALTATGSLEAGFAEYERGQARSQSSLGWRQAAPPAGALAGVQPRATTAPGERAGLLSPSAGRQGPGEVDMLVHVELCDVGTQCRPMELEQDPVDRLLRRYSFSLEWDHGTLGPGLLGSSKDAAPRHSAGTDGEAAGGGSGDQAKADESPATSEEQAMGDVPQQQLRAAATRPPRIPDRGRSVSKDRSADALVDRLRGRKATSPSSRLGQADGGLSAEPSMATLCSADWRRSRSPGPRAMNTVTPQVAMRFYEVKMTEEEADAPIDYTVDYRRYSYTDFKIPERGEGCSTVDPELIADWIDRAVPRNQDDAHPLFVLAKDLLHKFHQKEIRYAVRKEQDLLAEIQQLHARLMGDHAHNEELERQRELERARSEREKRELLQQIADMQRDMDWLRAELERYKELEAHMHMEMDEALKVIEKLAAEASDLNLQIKPLNVENWDLKVKLKELLDAKNAEHDARMESLQLQLQEQIKTLAALQSQLDEEQRRADEAEQVIRDLKAKPAMEWVAEWDYSTKTEVFKHFFESQPMPKPSEHDAHAMQEAPASAVKHQHELDQPSLRPKARAKADAKERARARTHGRVQARVAAAAGVQTADAAGPGAPAGMAAAGASAASASAEAAAEAAEAGAVVMAALFEKDDQEDEIEYSVAECITWEMFDSLPSFKKFEFTKKYIAGLKGMVEERIAEQAAGWTWSDWLDILGSLLNMPASAIFKHVFACVRADEWMWGEMVLGHQGAAEVRWEGDGWELVRGALGEAKVELDSLTALSAMCGEDELTLMAKIVGLDPKYIPMIKEHWDLFLKWVCFLYAETQAHANSRARTHTHHRERKR